MAANSSGTAPSAQTKSNPPSKEKETLLAVLQFLKKKNLSVSFINIVFNFFSNLLYFEHVISLKVSECIKHIFFCFRKLRKSSGKKSMG